MFVPVSSTVQIDGISNLDVHREGVLKISSN